MLVPGIRPGFRLPRPTGPLIAGFLGVVSALGIWAVVSVRSVSTDGVSLPLVSSFDVRSIAYSIPDPDAGVDRLFVRGADAGAGAVEVASFPYFAGLHARGAASPDGETVAVLSVDGSSGEYARLSLVALDARPAGNVDLTADYLGRVAWAGDSSRLAVPRTAPDGTVEVLEVSRTTGEAVVAAVFPRAFQVVPVGYGIDNSRLFLVVIDQAGSNLWQAAAGATGLVARLSPGNTRDWALSPDGARLAFVDVLGAGAPAYAGRTLTIATGDVTSQAATRDQLGSTWRPGSPAADFGGPGGSLVLSDPTPEAAYMLPMAYSPSGEFLVSTVYGDGPGPLSRPAQAIENRQPNVTRTGHGRTGVRILRLGAEPAVTVLAPPTNPPMEFAVCHDQRTR